MNWSYIYKMDIYNYTHNKLLESQYNRVEDNEINLLGCDLYVKADFSICVYKSLHIEDMNEINILSMRVRNYIQEKSYNIFNSYLLLLISEEMNYENFYLIERNNTGIRKYVIKHKKDLDRVTFFNYKNNSTKEFHSPENDIEKSELINKTLEILEQHNYSIYRFNEEKINFISELILEEVKNINENN